MSLNNIDITVKGRTSEENAPERVHLHIRKDTDSQQSHMMKYHSLHCSTLMPSKKPHSEQHAMKNYRL